jgi:hypothetical protein
MKCQIKCAPMNGEHHRTFNIKMGLHRFFGCRVYLCPCRIGSADLDERQIRGATVEPTSTKSFVYPVSPLKKTRCRGPTMTLLK